MPITAKEALAISKGVQEAKEQNWTKSEFRSLKRAYREIRRESEKGGTCISYASYKPKVYKELEKKGFTVVGHAAWDSWWTSVSWDK